MDIMPYIQILASFGVSVGASAFYDWLKSFSESHPTPTVQEFENELQSFLDINGATVQASTVINMFAAEGLLVIRGTSLYAPQQITMGAGPDARFQFGNDSVSETDKTRIEAQGNAQIVGNNAAIVQNPDGSISFMVGKKKDENK